MPEHTDNSNQDLDQTTVPQQSPSKPGATTDTSRNSTKPGSATTPSKKKKTVQLGDFKLLKKLGQGGMGEVYLATQVSLDRLVALKILSKEMAKKPGFVERFVREARAMARIDHPNAVKVYAADSDKGLNYVGIEYIDGQSMQDWIDQLGTLSIGDAIHVILCCADALNHAHELHLIHRDIKPDNVLVTKKGVVKVADFGLAKALDDEDMSMTQSGTGLGTPLYMPPEQARDAKNVDHRTDIYALGVTFYYFVTGKLPFEGGSVLKLIVAKEKGQYEPARKLNPKVPEKLSLMIDKMIQKEPKHRYSTCAEIMHDLDQLGLESEVLSFIDDTGSGAGTASRTSRGRQRSGVTSDSGTTSGVSIPQFRTSAEDATQAEAAAAAKDTSVWYVRYTNKKGDSQVKEMNSRQVQQGILAEVLDVKAQAQKKGAAGGFLPLAAHPEFQDLMKKRLAKTQHDVRGDNLKMQYAQLEKEQRKHNRWRWIKGITENVLGGFGLIIYLVVIAAVIFGIYWGIVNILYPMISSQIDSSTTTTPATPDLVE
ncbi:MAG: serine/threonine-protein kinase [Planctomycetota bacterium]|nr:serine/threonine-protein kinase [Planctomycetota bacterium]MDA1164129.1 serine/threonine-protein kinase [Planctomycetota bacterium]